MSDTIKTLCIIPARSGSKGLLRKNIMPLHGKPLIHWAVKAARDSGVIDEIFVSTDDEEFAEIARNSGASVPFLRSDEHARDESTTEDTLHEALELYENHIGYKFDICVFLTCTDIFRKPEWIDQAIEIMIKNHNIESVFSGNQTHKNFWQKNEFGKWERLKDWMSFYSSRQIRRYVVREDTGLCCVSRSFLWKEGRRIGNNVEILENKDLLTAVDIHTIEDLKIAEILLKMRFSGEI